MNAGSAPATPEWRSSRPASNAGSPAPERLRAEGSGLVCIWSRTQDLIDMAVASGSVAVGDDERGERPVATQVADPRLGRHAVAREALEKRGPCRLQRVAR